MKCSFLSVRDGHYKWGLRGLIALAILGGLFIFGFSHTANAVTTVPTTMNFQGRLTNSSGTILADGLYNMKFRLFTVSSGGSNVWNELRETTNRVQVTNGLFSVKLGAVTPIPASLFASGSLYFEIELPTPATATCSTSSCATFTEGAMTPRSEVTTSAYAFNSETLDGLDSASFAQVAANNTFTGTNLFKPSSDTATGFQVQNAGTAPMLTADAANDRIYVGNTSADAVGVALVLDTKNTAGDPTGVDGAMYYNSSSKSFRCASNSLWRDCDFASLRSEWLLQEEFANSSTATLTLGTYGWSFAQIGTSIAPAKINAGADASDQDRFGVLRLGTAATSATGSRLFLDQTGMAGVPSNMNVEFSFGTAVAAAATGQQDVIRIGLHNSTSASAPTTGMYFQYVKTTTAGNWERCTQATCVDTGVAYSTTLNQYQRFRIQTNSAGTAVEFFINETSVGVVSTNLPAATDAYGPAVNVSTTEAVQKLWKLDYFEIKRNLTTLR